MFLDSKALRGWGLTSVPGGLNVSGNEILTNLSGLANVTSIEGGLIIFDNASLSNLDWQALVNVGNDLDIWANAALTSIQFDSLTTIGGKFEIHGNEFIGYNLVLNSVVFDALTNVGDEFQVHENPVLANISMNQLATVGGDRFDIENNPKFPTCAAEALVDQLIDFTGQISISGNDDSGTCY